MEREAWMEGSLTDVSPLLMPAAHALVQAARDIRRAASGLTSVEIWTNLNGAPSVGFHLRHVAGSIDRLLTYSRSENLTQQQFAALAAESEMGDDAAMHLVEAAAASIEEALAAIKATSNETLFDARFVGRERLPTNVFGLLFHIAEHTQRHVGQIVTTARIVRVTGESI